MIKLNGIKSCKTAQQKAQMLVWLSLRGGARPCAHMHLHAWKALACMRSLVVRLPWKTDSKHPHEQAPVHCSCSINIITVQCSMTQRAYYHKISNPSHHTTSHHIMSYHITSLSETDHVRKFKVRDETLTDLRKFKLWRHQFILPCTHTSHCVHLNESDIILHCTLIVPARSIIVCTEAATAGSKFPVKTHRVTVIHQSNRKG